MIKYIPHIKPGRSEDSSCNVFNATGMHGKQQCCGRDDGSVKCATCILLGVREGNPILSLEPFKGWMKE